ncbi:c-type cytochrome [Campylobacter lari]|uniref:c-type cytochrome n=1 Tax=Campylobacter lari TaxID=201 RepID=UPI00214A1831|nr:c-type cytochrome [Campylobacter lari]MCR2076445.1 c-type cytochrome [Campylobacter lari subsp. concheus]MCR2084130.1 c-type cytochrome [Campylobacter lari subsp. concheus]MCR2085734.1 c-type cytochrome [Campylobacter lari subsp. concheus]MCV3419212.1 c-type cytochrome [Campylobacter lari]MCV3422379.1 c-type cytochrome [Campylobacter lari]
MLRLFIVSVLFANSLLAFNVKSLFTYTFNDNISYNLEKAKEIYFKNKCNTCHGENGEKKSYGKRALKDLSPEEIKGALKDYANGYFKNQSSDNIQMSLYAKNLSNDDMNHIIAYLKGQNFSIELNQKDLLEEEPTPKTKNNIFLK